MKNLSTSLLALAAGSVGTLLWSAPALADATPPCNAAAAAAQGPVSLHDLAPGCSPLARRLLPRPLSDVCRRPLPRP